MTERDPAPTRLRIDAHHHLWRYNQEEYAWLQDDLACLRRDCSPEDLLVEMRAADVTGAVAVQARQTAEETASLLEIAASHREILGVVGWLPIADRNFAASLERYAHHPHLKGLRHVVQGEPSGFMARADFNQGIQYMAASGLVFDILIYQHQLREAIDFVDRHPGQAFVLDHLAKPRITAKEVEPWARHLRELARRANVTCKVSGMVTEAGAGWTPEELQPYFDVALEAFTPARLMVGTDWPVLTAACGYGLWWQTVARWITPLSADEQADILGATAVRTYRLDVPERSHRPV